VTGAAYEFEDVATGERVERRYPLGRAPKRLIRVGGRTLRRIITAPSVRVDHCEHVSHSLPPSFAAQTEHSVTDKNGMRHAAFTSRKQIRELEARTGWTYGD
jgi:hypothetical protein